MYPYMTLNDDTEITHSEMLPDYTWENNGYSETKLEYFKTLVKNNAYLMIEFSQEGGLSNASNLVSYPAIDKV